MAREKKDVLSDSEIAYREFWDMVLPDDADCENALMRLLAAVWDESALATAEWMSNNPSPSGIPHDPPRNPYEEA